MQLDGNSFYVDVVLDRFNKASRNEHSILNQICKEICSDFYYDDFNSL